MIMEMFTVAKRFTFSASHMLDQLRPSHKCRRLHGHTYNCLVRVDATKLDGNGMVMDFACFAPLIEAVRLEFDHRHLNDVMDEYPTAENIAKAIFEMAEQTLTISGELYTITIQVSEQPETYAEYSRTIHRNKNE
jgi:6-pyruvoyltetrahydropterin/6-carboxytetrahydropterin synthase